MTGKGFLMQKKSIGALHFAPSGVGKTMANTILRQALGEAAHTWKSIKNR
jgi:hypothetical protein